jgi:hypothetical protein
MKRLPLALALLCSPDAGAESVDWIRAERGIQFGGSIAFSGCAPAKSISDGGARKIARLRAQANLARSRSVSISGEEHMFTDRQDNARYDMAVSETTGAFLHPVTVVREIMTQSGTVSELCLLVVENP